VREQEEGGKKLSFNCTKKHTQILNKKMEKKLVKEKMPKFLSCLQMNLQKFSYLIYSSSDTNSNKRVERKREREASNTSGKIMQIRPL
jgi:hypothetical protein